MAGAGRGFDQQTAPGVAYAWPARPRRHEIRPQGGATGLVDLKPAAEDETVNAAPDEIWLSWDTEDLVPMCYQNIVIGIERSCANNEQGLAFEVHAHDWIPVDHEGIHLILRAPPTPPTPSGAPPANAAATDTQSE